MAYKQVQYLRSKTLKSGRTLWFWEPSAALRKAGWKPVPFGEDEAAAFAAAEARNKLVETWKAGGERPREVRRIVRASTVSAMIAHYKAAGWPRLSDNLRPIADGTRSTYSAAFDKIERWSGDTPVSAISPERVAVFRDALRKAFGRSTAYNTLAVGRTLFRYGARSGLCSKANPFDDFGLTMADPRQQIWDEDGTGRDLEDFAAGAAATGYPELELAVELFMHLGQREDDMLKLPATQWREVKNLPPAEHEALVHHDGPDAGRVMGFSVRQGKTKRWVGIPIAGDLRRRVEAQIARNRARPVPVTTILVNEHTGRPWAARRFIEHFNDARASAVAELVRRGEAERAERMAELQIRDLRRTAVVKMGELNLEDQLISAITGHSLATIKKMLEIYMPRTTKMAARAVVARMEDARSAAGRRDAKEERA